MIRPLRIESSGRTPTECSEGRSTVPGYKGRNTTLMAWAFWRSMAVSTAVR